MIKKNEQNKLKVYNIIIIIFKEYKDSFLVRCYN